MTLSCKISFARFSVKLKFQDRAECGNTGSLNLSGRKAILHGLVVIKHDLKQIKNPKIGVFHDFGGCFLIKLLKICPLCKLNICFRLLASKNEIPFVEYQNLCYNLAQAMLGSALARLKLH